MSSQKTNRLHLAIFLFAILFVSLGTYLTIYWAKGYRPTKNGQITSTGLLSANSFPKGAQVYINDRLTTATDDTLNLSPGQYQVTIKKDGYHPWHKQLTITKELVTQTNATLYPTTPSLIPLTFTGALHPTPSPDGNKIAFAVASASATPKNGLYIVNLSSNLPLLNKSLQQIAPTTSQYDFSQATLTWSPDSQQLIASFPNGANLLLQADKFNSPTTFRDVTVLLPSLLKDWELAIARTDYTKLKEFPPFILKVATTSAQNVYVSPDNTKMLYQATRSLTIPDTLIPPIPSASTQPQQRTLQPGNFYVYDRKEDRNFLILENELHQDQLAKTLLLQDPSRPPTPTNTPSTSATTSSTSTANPPLYQTPNQSPQKALALIRSQYSSFYTTPIQWLPDSYHLLITQPDKITIIEYDHTNPTPIYSGPFHSSFIYPSPDGDSILTLLQLSPSTPANIYAIKLK